MTPPIACSLGAAELADRGRAWRTVLALATAREEVDGGLLVTFRENPGLVDTLVRLAGLEAACCPWMRLSVTPAPPALLVRASAEGVEAVRRLFPG